MSLKNIFLTVLVVLFSAVQAQQRIVLYDSVSFSLPISETYSKCKVVSCFCIADNFYLFDIDNRMFYALSYKKETKSLHTDTSFHFAHKIGCISNVSFVRNTYSLQGVRHSLRAGYKLNFYTSDFERTHQIPLQIKSKFFPTFWNIFDISGVKVSQNEYIFPIAKIEEIIGGMGYRKLYYYKKRPHLAARYLLKDSLLTEQNFYGMLSSVYTQKLLPHLYSYDLTADTIQQRLFISQKAVPDIQIWDIKTKKHLTTLTSAGKHTNPEYDTPKAWNKKTDNSIRLDYSPEIQKRIECTVYSNVYYDHNSKLLYRIYTIGKKDTVRHHIKTKQEWKEYKKKHGRTCGSPLPEIIANQIRLEQSKPYGLQIYNEKYELIFDEIMPTPFNILKIENNEIWVHGRYDEANQKYWIYKYHIETK